MDHMPHEPGDSDDPVGALVTAVGHDRAEIEQLCAAILAAMAERRLSHAAQFAVRLAWEEAVSNAIHHGNQDRLDGRIEVAYHVDASRVFIRISDEGDGFEPATVLDPTLDENLECLSGRGLLLMRAYMTRVEFPAPGNTVRMLLENPSAP